jgi:hypothetical protein
MQVINFGRDRSHQIDDMIIWCSENIGIGNYTQGYNDEDWKGIRSWSIEKDVIYIHGRGWRFTFKHDQDATLFKLIWK